MSASISVRSPVARPAGVREGERWPSRLRRGNLIVGMVHLAQAVALLALGNGFSLPITASFLAGPPGSDLTAPDSVWKVPVGPAVGIFLLFAALDHLLMASPGINGWYNANLRRGVNYARWWEYSISTIMIDALIEYSHHRA